jgi:hypothetical protein
MGSENYLALSTKCHNPETDLGPVAVRQTQACRSNKINISRAVRPYTGSHYPAPAFGCLDRCQRAATCGFFGAGGADPRSEQSGSRRPHSSRMVVILLAPWALSGWTAGRIAGPRAPFGPLLKAKGPERFLFGPRQVWMVAGG